MKKTFLILLLAVPMFLFGNKTTQDVLTDAQGVSFKHESNTRFLISDSSSHYVIAKDDIGQLSIEGVFNGHLVTLEKLDQTNYNHYNETYFVLLEDGENHIYYKDDQGYVYSVKLVKDEVVETALENVEELTASNPDDEADDDEGMSGGGKTGISFGTIILLFILFKVFFD